MSEPQCVPNSCTRRGCDRHGNEHALGAAKAESPPEEVPPNQVPSFLMPDGFGDDFNSTERELDPVTTCRQGGKDAASKPGLCTAASLA